MFTLLLAMALGQTDSGLWHPKAGDAAYLAKQGGGTVTAQGRDMLTLDMVLLSLPNPDALERMKHVARGVQDGTPAAVEAANQMVEAGWAANLVAGTRVKVVKTITGVKSTYGYQIYEIAIQEGPFKGINLWANMAWLSPKPDPELLAKRRQREIAATRAKRLDRKAWLAQQHQEEELAAARVAAVQAELIRVNTPDYISITRDGTGKVIGVYTSTPNGHSEYRTPTGVIVNDTQSR